MLVYIYNGDENTAGSIIGFFVTQLSHFCNVNIPPSYQRPWHDFLNAERPVVLCTMCTN
jgi:hypothetical protein